MEWYQSKSAEYLQTRILPITVKWYRQVHVNIPQVGRGAIHIGLNRKEVALMVSPVSVANFVTNSLFLVKRQNIYMLVLIYYQVLIESKRVMLKQ